MGNMYTAYISSPDTAPDIKAGPTFDPLYGFENGRKERHMKVTEEEMEAAGIEPEHRDYCAHFLIEFRKCRQEHFPWVVACKPQLHNWDNCQYEDFVLRMKEYERERRLLERAKTLRLRKGQDAELLTG
jgi:NADH dehydrogenase (ubiquinone) 1 beta subcomplex subunit 7